MTDTTLQGHLLLAAPQMLDPNFAKSVVLIAQHDEEGALGVVLNRPTDATVAEAWCQISEAPCDIHSPLYVGGPCEGLLVALHTEADLSDREVLPGLYFSASEEHIEALIARQIEQARFYVGYSGWSPGQLEMELATESWLPVPAILQHAFADSNRLWDDVIADLARNAIDPVDPRLRPDDPSLN